MNTILRIAFVGLAVAVSMPTQAEKMSERFPEFANNPQRVQKVALIVDTFYMSDIEGSVGGIYKEDSELLTPVLTEIAKQRMENLGYEVPYVHANSGLFASPEMKLVYAKNKKGSSRN